MRLQVRSKLFGDLLLSVIDFNIVEVCVCEPSVHCRFALCIQASSFDIRAFIGQVWLVIVFGDMKRVTFELGGKSPMIVCDDVGLDQAVTVAENCLFLNAGQCCCASSRLLVQDAIYDVFFPQSSCRNFTHCRSHIFFIFWAQSGGQTCKLNCHNVLEAPHPLSTT